MSKVNLAIIGGGLVGASLALALQAGARERGWSIVLIEPFAPGNATSPATTPALRRYPTAAGRSTSDSACGRRSPSAPSRSCISMFPTAAASAPPA